MTTLSYDLSADIDLENQNVVVNANVSTVPSGSYDVALVAYANFLSGNYEQDPENVNDIKSSVAYSNAAVSGAFTFYVANVAADKDAYPHGGLSDFGKNIVTTSAVFGSAATDGIQKSGEDALAFGSIAPFDSNTGATLVAMTNMDKSTGLITSSKLQEGASGVGHGLMQAINSALFKSLGKNAAILNDSASTGGLVQTLQDGLNTELHSIINEDEANSEDSTMFQKYLGTGLYEDEGSDITGTPIDYQLNNATVNMMINISGFVNDSDGPDFSTNTDAITQVFGVAGTDHKISVTGGSGSVGKYNVRVFLQLIQDGRL